MIKTPPLTGVYGSPPRELVTVAPDAVQLSPLHPGSIDWNDLEGLDGVAMLAPPGTIERRYAMARALGVLKQDGVLTVLAPKDKGGSRLAGDLKAFGCAFDETSRRHHRICTARRPAVIAGAEAAIEAGSLRRVPAINLWSQAGVFSWDRIDPGSALLASRLPALAGRGSDLGCGVGFLSLAVLGSAKLESLDLVDIDRRAVEAARLNVVDPRARFHWADAAEGGTGSGDLDFVVMNPPFHDAGTEDRGLGQAFIRAAAKSLRTGGACWLVANRHLPYEAVLAAEFKTVRLDAESGGYKVYEARR